MAALPRFNWLIGVVSALFLLLANVTAAQAVVIDFNVVPPGGQALGTVGASHSEDGFTVAGNNTQLFILGDGFGTSGISNGTAFGLVQQPVMAFTLSGPPSFSIQSIDLGFAFFSSFDGNLVNAVGNFSGGGTISQAFSVPAFVFQTFVFSGAWSNLDSVDFTFLLSDFLAVDNITVNESVSEIPIPGAVWLFLSAIVGLVSISRIQRRRQTT